MSCQPEHLEEADRAPTEPIDGRRTWILPPSVAKRLARRPAGRFSDKVSFHVGEAADTFHVAAWMAAVGWDADDLAAAILKRERNAGAEWGSSWLSPTPDELGELATDLIALGRYLVFGTEPPLPARREDERDVFYRFRISSTWARTSFKNPKVVPTGAPAIGRADLESYLADVLAAFDGEPSTRTSQTDKAVLMAAVDIARAACTIVPTLAVRRVAELANVNKETAGKALARLQASGFLRPFGERPVAAGQAFLVRGRSYVPDSSVSTVTGTCRRDINCPDGETLPGSHPAFHQRAHGKTGLAMLRALMSPPSSDGAWMAAANVKRAAFYRHKKELTGGIEGLAALALKDDNGWHLVSAEQLNARLDEHAEYFGTDNLVGRRNARMKADQQGFRAYLLRQIADSYAPHDNVSAVRLSTGELIPYSDLVDYDGTPKLPPAESVATKHTRRPTKVISCTRPMQRPTGRAALAIEHTPRTTGRLVITDPFVSDFWAVSPASDLDSFFFDCPADTAGQTTQPPALQAA